MVRCAGCRRDIDKAGGLDQYILHTKEKHLASERALELRGTLKEELRRIEERQRT